MSAGLCCVRSFEGAADPRVREQNTGRIVSLGDTVPGTVSPSNRGFIQVRDVGLCNPEPALLLGH